MPRFYCLFLSFLLSLIPLLGCSKETVSLREKIGQMLLIGFNGKAVQADSEIVKRINEDNIGGVILFDYDFQTETFNKNIESPAQVKQLNQALQFFTRQSNQAHHRPNLPLLISVDYEGGNITRLDKKYGFPDIPSAADVGKTQSLSYARKIAQRMAETLQETGFNLDFAPVLDLNSNPNNPVIGKKNRSFSAQPKQVQRFARQYTKQFQKHHIQCAYKHFPGHGSSLDDSHLGFVDISSTWQTKELIPYRHLLKYPDACAVVMTAHLVNHQLDESGKPATLSYKVLTRLLRKQLHFRGVVITDDLQMKAISDNYPLEETLELAINAGADMLMFGNNLSVGPQDPKEIIDIIVHKVQQGKISTARINEAYHRILRLKRSIK